MSFELKSGESLAEGIQRAGRESLDFVRATLSAGESGARPGPDAIHLARKELKNLRALLRLARSGISESVFRSENLAYRDIGRSLSAARDAAVLVKAFNDLRPILYGLVSPETIASIHDRLQGAVTASEAQLDLAAAISELGPAAERVGDWPWLHDADAWKVPADGLRRVYRHGRRAMRRASVENPAEGDFHEWRKRVKMLSAQFCLLQAIHPEELKCRARELDHLATCLGEEHDLAVLQEKLLAGHDGHLEPAAERDTIRRMVDARRCRLQRKALKRGRKQFQERPADLVARLKGHWKHWRRGS